MSWTPVFAMPCDVFAPDWGGTEPRAKFGLAIALSSADKTKVRFSMAKEGGATEEVTFDLVEAHDVNLAHLDKIDVVEIRIDLASKTARSRFEALGATGLKLSLAADLRSVTIRLRGPDDTGRWTSEAPFLAILLCWDLTGKLVAGSKFLTEDETTGKTEVNEASAALEATVAVCAGFSLINPPSIDVQLSDLQVRLDLEAMGVGTGWLPFSRIDFGGLSAFHLNGLGKWFSGLLKAFDADFAGIELPDWDLDLPLDIDLPLGIAFRETALAIRRFDGAYGIDASAKGLILHWGEAPEFEPEDVELALRLIGEGMPPEWRYEFRATLFETHSEAVAFSLPFDLLKLSAACWRFRLGLHASGDTTKGPVHFCAEALLEIGGLEIRSVLGDGGLEPVYSTDLRLLMRNFTLMFAELTDAGRPIFFEGLDPVEPYKTYMKPIPALSFAGSLNLAPETGPANDYGLTFVDGDVRKGERFYVAWKQQGNQLLKALAHDLFGSEPAGKIPDDAKAIEVAVELAWFGDEDARATQLRIDWSDGEEPDKREPGGSAPVPTIGWELIPNDDAPTHRCIKFSDLVDRGLSLPIDAAGVDLRNEMRNARRFELPGIDLRVAAPDAQSIVIRRDADGAASVSYMLIYETGQVADAEPAAPIARADIGLSTTEAGGGARESLETTNGKFATLAIGHAGADATAFRIIGWKQGAAPRFIQTYAREAVPLTRLTGRKNPDAAQLGCPTPAPPPKPSVPLAFDSFVTPHFGGADHWRLTVRFAAESAFLKLFGGDDTAGPVKFSISRICVPVDSEGNPDPDATHLLIVAALEVKLNGELEEFSAEGEATLRFEPADLSLSIEGDARLALALKASQTKPAWAERVPLPELGKDRLFAFSEEKSILGFKATFLSDEAEGAVLEKIEFLALTIDKGRFKLALPEGKHMVLRFTGLGADSLNFWVDTFEMGPGGVDLDARLVLSTLGVKGLKKPFALKEAGLRIRDNKLQTLSIAASGALPEILDEAPVDLSITFTQERPGGKIELDELICKLGSEGEPIFSRGTRFKFELNKLDLRYQRPSPKEDRHFFFEITGSAEFAPDPGEFDGGLLEDLKAARMDFVRAPLTEEFTKHISFSVELNEPKSFGVFNLFRMEIRSIGFHPDFQQFEEPGPALIIGGQMEFADIGDVISPEIDFHAMYIGLPRTGEVVPQVHFDGLRVEISSPEGFRIAGRVDRYKSDALQGFGGEGTVQIPGFPELSAAFAFVKLRNDVSERWRRGWFIAIEATKISYQMGALPVYLRQIGLGFGYRYTLPLIREFEQKETLRELIDVMLEALDRHQTLARLDSWVPDPERPSEQPRWTIALEAVFTLGSSQKAPFDYKAKEEQKIKTVIAQILAAIRSDFTLLAAAKVWYPVSVDDLFENVEEMRRRPLASGFMIYSVPQKRFLAHAAKGKNPYLGKPDDPVPNAVKNVLNNSHFEATMLIEPSLLHAELGWPDRLMFRMEAGSLRLECRGGVLFRAENDVLIQGVFFSARGSVDLAGGVSRGFVGFRVSAHVEVYFATRLMTALYLSRPLASRIYAQVGLDVAVRFSVQAWLRLKIGFCRINISISFSFSLQIMIAIDIGWAGEGQIGFRGRATVVLSVFGRSLSARIAVGLNDGAVERARVALAPYMASFLKPGEIPPVPDGTLERKERLLAGSGPSGTPLALAPDGGEVAATAAPVLDAAERARLEEKAQGTEFVTSHVTIDLPSKERSTLVWIMPGPGGAAFYPAIAYHGGNEWIPYARLSLPERRDVWVYEGGGAFTKKVDAETVDLKARPNQTLTVTPDVGDAQPLSLQKMLAGCYAVDPNDYVLKVDRDRKNDRFFPEFWPNNPPRLKLPPEDKLEPAQTDERVRAPEDPARAPRREIDPRSEYDRILVEALETGEEREADPYTPSDPLLEEQIAEQAKGNQTYLLQTFYDALVKIAEAVEAAGRWEEVDLAALFTEAREARPTVLDTGMVIRIDGDLPDWAMTREPATAYPTLSFHAENVVMPEAPDLGTALMTDGYVLCPVVDFRAADFARNPPVLRESVAYFDEDVVGLSWDLDWAAGAPNAADGVDTDPERFLRTYRIDFIDLSNNQSLGSYTRLPVDLIAKKRGAAAESAQGKLKRLRPRYKITVPTRELFPGGGADRQTLRQVSATVMPVGQTGGLGISYSFTLSEEPTLTPLPPDDAELMLSLPETPPEGASDAGDDKDASLYRATIRWRKLSLPSQPGIARTDLWELVLRPLSQVPMGAYPDEAADPTDRGLMSVTGQALMEGDVIIRMPDSGSGVPLPDGMESAPPDKLDDDEARDPADAILALTLDPRGKGTGDAYRPRPEDIRDHNGQKATEDSYAARTAAAFFDGLPADRAKGRAWRLYLRAGSLRAKSGSTSADDDEAMTLSGLMPVRLMLSLPEIETGIGEDPLKRARRPLPHFEWPGRERGGESAQVEGPEAAAGALHIPAPLMGEEDTEPPAPDMAAEVATDPTAPLEAALTLDYTPEPGRARGVSISWSAVGTGADARFEAVAEYALHRAPLDEMVNADAADKSEFRPAWQQVARILPSDPQVARQTPDTMDDAQNWAAWTPAFVATNSWMARGDIPRQEQKRRAPGWFSWAESDLVWPDPEKNDDPEKNKYELDGLIKETREAEASDSAGAAPLERLEAVERKDPARLTATDLKQIIAAWSDLGNKALGRATHPYLSVVLGRVSVTPAHGQRVPYDLQGSTSQPVSIRDPLAWMRANAPAVDPFGWNALGHLGLSVTFALRERTTGLLIPQTRLREALVRAIRDVDEVIAKLAELAPEYTPVAKKAAQRMEHLAFDLPLQAEAAYRPEPEAAELGRSSLGMMQIALRPAGRQLFDYSQFTVKSMPEPPSDAEGTEDEWQEPTITPTHAVDLFYANSTKAVRRLEGDVPVAVRTFLDEYDVVIVRHEPKPEGTGAGIEDGQRPGAALREKLQSAGVVLHDGRKDWIVWPLPAEPREVENQRTPFEKFSVPVKFLERRLAKIPPPNDDGTPSNKPWTAKDEQFKRFITYLEAAFATSDEAGERVKPEIEIRKLVPVYFAWSQRFFASAPLPAKPPRPAGNWAEAGYTVAHKHPRNITLAAPLVSDPLRAAPDASGLLRVTQREDEEWASTRSYALIPTGRYDALHAAMRGGRVRRPAPTIADAARRADVQLPRVRKVEPPQVLAQRLLPGEAGRYYHEVTMATHVEEALSNSNIHMARKIEFGAVMRSFERAFPREDWIARLKLPNALPPVLPEDGPPEAKNPKALPDLDEYLSDFLTHSPQARWGATRAITLAAPYYYEQGLRYRASAAAELSEEKLLPLLRSPAADAVPMDEAWRVDGRSAVDTGDAAWGPDWGDSGFDRAALHDAWAAVLGAEELGPGGWRLRMRAPRFVESLAPDAVAGEHAAELGERAIGRLPDQDVALHIAAVRAGTTETLATLGEAGNTPEAPGAPGFALRPVAAGAMFGPLVARGHETWDKGVWLEVTAAPTRPVESDDLSGGAAPHVPDAPDLAAPSSALLRPGELPSAGPLAQLAPLAIRLTVACDAPLRLRVLRPLTGTWRTKTGARRLWAPTVRAALRPSLAPLSVPGRLPAQAPDLGIGLRLLVDLERRRAAGMLSFDIWRREAAGEDGAALRTLMDALERGPATYLTDPTALEGLTPAMLEEAMEREVRLWRRAGDDDEPAEWLWIEEPLPNGTEPREVLILAESIEHDNWDATFDQLVATFGDTVNRPATAAGLVALGEQMLTLGKNAHAPNAPPRLRVFSQRGNRPRRPWDGEEA